MPLGIVWKPECTVTGSDYGYAKAVGVAAAGDSETTRADKQSVIRMV